MGSVFKRGEGKTWNIKYELPRGADGERKSKMQACPGMTKKEAENELAEIERNIRRGEYASTTHTVASFFEEWLGLTRPTLKVGTADMYKYVVNAHIIPELGGVKLTKLTPMQVQRFYQRLQEATYRSPQGGKSVRNIHALLHKALADAMLWGLLSRNPGDNVVLPKVEKPEISTASAHDLQRLIYSLDAYQIWRMPVLISLFTAMRCGEVVALQWQDYDANAHTIAVRRAASQYKWEITIKETKNGHARVIYLNDAFVQALDAYAKTAEYHAPTDFICCNQDGSILPPKTYSKAFAEIRSALGLPITLHGLRHTQATLMLADGASPQVVAERLGHRRTSTTMDVYAHVMPHMQKEAVETLDGLKI